MATQAEVWIANDGSYWTTESQALAYEMKLFLINLGKSAQAIQVDATGKIDEAGMTALANVAASSITINAATLSTAISAVAVAAVTP